MWLKPIKVQCYSGYKAEEEPRKLCIDDCWVEVVEILDRWHQMKFDPEWPLADYFKVLCNNRMLYLIKHDLESDEWFLIKVWQIPHK